MISLKLGQSQEPADKNVGRSDLQEKEMCDIKRFLPCFKEAVSKSRGAHICDKAETEQVSNFCIDQIQNLSKYCVCIDTCSML